MLTAVLWAAPVAAQQAQRCAPHPVVIQMLAKEYKERPVAVALMTDGTMLHVAATEDGSMWTIIRTLPNGISCFVAAGQNWRSIEWRALEMAL